MCVILQIEPGVTVPADKLARACDINPNGYGIAYAAGSGLRVIRSVKKNDPQEVQDHLAKHTDKRVFVHLRYATVGEVTMENNHPFIVLSHKRTFDIGMMHNGTISSYTPKKDDVCSDTQLFAKALVGPAAERSAAYLGSNKVLTDPIFRRIVDLEAGISVLVLFDRWGNVFRTNENRGKQFEGWWASNDYSFDDKHFRSSVRVSSTPAWERAQRGRQGPGHWMPRYEKKQGLPWEEDKVDPITDAMAESWRKETATKHVLPFEVSPHVLTKAVAYNRIGFQTLTTQAKAIGMKVSEVKDTDASIRNLSVPRTTFIEMAGMKSLDDLGCLTSADIEDLCRANPAAMSQMFVDMYGEMRDLKLNNTNQARTILGLTKDKAAANVA